MADISRPTVDFTNHPDMSEMRDRYARVLGGPPAVAVDGLILLAGLYTAISPWVVGFGAAYPRLAIDNLIIGLAVAVLACGLTAAPTRMFRLSWAMAAIGVWQIITPWVIGPDTVAVVWNNVVTGGVITVLSAAAAAMLMSTSTSRRATR
ncbi:SPW repeat protein [Kutzneria kofuensis]|uniref:SPW repeat-containing integral membrane domain-containing protein n=1 Tax=Kutzneria kofuensis TaxID=103725 RepID=A0A7W9KP62_9PSEU|nr:SPW repeat protein [Kutzneria kofuensis]MBB5896174.1 hypothetical protein [Kutzneria kofuensis]